jgi:hypothetical protein
MYDTLQLQVSPPVDAGGVTPPIDDAATPPLDLEGAETPPLKGEVTPPGGVQLPLSPLTAMEEPEEQPEVKLRSKPKAKPEVEPEVSWSLMCSKWGLR